MINFDIDAKDLTTKLPYNSFVKQPVFSYSDQSNNMVMPSGKYYHPTTKQMSDVPPSADDWLLAAKVCKKWYTYHARTVLSGGKGGATNATVAVNWPLKIALGVMPENEKACMMAWVAYAMAIDNIDIAKVDGSYSWPIEPDYPPEFSDLLLIS